MKRRKWVGLLACVMMVGLSACGAAKQAEDGSMQEDGVDIMVDAERSGSEGTEVVKDKETDKMDLATEGSVPDKDPAKSEESGANAGDRTMPETDENSKGTEDSVTDDRIKLSILGDSISTFDGWIPEGNSAFFPEDGAVQNVSETWWKLVLDETGMILCANGSSSGSTCSGDSRTNDVMVACCDHRIAQLTGADGKLPDIIIVYMGTNDVVQSVPMGENDGLQPVAEGIVDSFSDAYSLILDKLGSRYPGAQIYCCTLAPLGDWGTDQPFVPFVNGQGLTSEDYSKRIRLIAENRGIPVIDLYHCGIEIDNLSEMTSDGVHLTPEGMRRVAEEVLKILLM